MLFSEILQSGEVGAAFQRQQAEKRLVTETWDRAGVLKGLKNPVQKENMAQLFENQAQWFLTESSDSTSSGSFETVAFPIIRRVFQKLLANEVASIQTLNLPIGRLYFLNPKTSKRTTGSPARHYVFDGVYSNAATADATAKTQYETVSLYDQWYNKDLYNDDFNGLFDLTKGAITIVSQQLNLSESFTPGTNQTLKVQLSGFSITNAGKLVGPAGVPVDTEEFLSSLVITSNTTFTSALGGAYSFPAGSPLFYRVITQKYGDSLVRTRDASGASLGTGVVDLEIQLSTPNTAGAYLLPLTSATAASGITFNGVYKIYSNMEEDAQIPQVSFDFKFVTVDVTTRKLGATFTQELQQDVSAFQSVDVEAELTAMLSEVVSGEIDREILRDMRKGGAFLEIWDYAAYDRMKSVNLALTRKDYNQELITKVNLISAKIQQATLKGGATFLIVSPMTQAILNDLEYFHATDASAEETKFSLGIEKIGSIQNRYQVFVDNYAPAGTILVGHKGSSIFDSGYIYAPYVPLMLFPKGMNPADFKPVMGIMTRYAKKLVNNRFFGKVIVQNTPFLNTSEFV